MGIIKKLSWFFKLEKKRYLLGVLALSLVSLFNLIPPRTMGNVIDSITSGTLTHTELLLNMVYLLLAAFAMYGLRYIWRMYILGTSYRLGNSIRSQLFRHFTTMPPAFFQEYRTGDLMAHATNDINVITMFAGGGVMSAVDASITVLVTLITMFVVLHWQLTVIAVIPLPFMAWAVRVVGRKNHESFKQAQASFSSLNNHVQERISGIKVAKSFGYQQQEMEAFEVTNQENFQKQMMAMRYNHLFDPMGVFFVGMSYMLTIMVGMHLIGQNQLSVGGLITFLTYLDMLVWPFKAIAFLMNTAQRADASYDRIASILAKKSNIEEVSKSVAVCENGTLTYAIDQFSYTPQQITLEAIHFSIEKGQTLGIVGPTGSGKTTLFKLLLRQRNIDKGAILLDQYAIDQFTLTDLRSLIGYVMQDPFLFAMSIKDTIRFGNMSLDDEAIIQATKLCGVYEDIMAMPDGFDTLIGEKGVLLSGGQKQRIAMSRALVLNPDILLLDDSLSAIDAKTEHHILTNLYAQRQQKTTLIIAHRLSAVVQADKIIVLDKGKIIESGTHEELLANKGWYYTTYQSQQLEMDEKEVA